MGSGDLNASTHKADERHFYFLALLLLSLSYNINYRPNKTELFNRTSAATARLELLMSNFVLGSILATHVHLFGHHINRFTTCALCFHVVRCFRWTKSFAAVHLEFVDRSATLVVNLCLEVSDLFDYFAR